MERAVPSRLGKEVGDHVHDVIEADISVGQIGSWSFETPIDHYWRTYDIFARHETPETAVIGIVAIVSHRKDISWRHHKFVVDHVFLQHLRGARSLRLAMRVG